MICEKCGKEFFEDWRKDKKSRKTPCRFCSRNCSNLRIITNETKEKIKNKLLKEPVKKCFKCGIKIRKNNITGFCKKCRVFSNVITKKTKKEMFKDRKNWQSARSCIRKNAYTNYFVKNKKEYKCIICGYDKYVEVAHKKSVSSFLDEDTIEKINDINNLIGLCPNHHWEYDNGLLNL